jgi:hypothetical protein
MVGIVMNDGGDREIVQVKGPCQLHIGMKGEIETVENSAGAFNFFVPG